MLPGEECRVVIRADVLDVFNDENAFRSARQLSDGRKHGVWENVVFDPWIGMEARKVSADSLAKSRFGAVLVVPAPRSLSRRLFPLVFTALLTIADARYVGDSAFAECVAELRCFGTKNY